MTGETGSVLNHGAGMARNEPSIKSLCRIYRRTRVRRHLPLHILQEEAFGQNGLNEW